MSELQETLMGRLSGPILHMSTENSPTPCMLRGGPKRDSACCDPIITAQEGACGCIHSRR
jgi:hypothetical protein